MKTVARLTQSVYTGTHICIAIYAVIKWPCVIKHWTGRWGKKRKKERNVENEEQESAKQLKRTEKERENN